MLPSPAVVLGVTMIGLAFLASRLGGLIQATATIMSIVGGPSMGVFLLGICVPIVGEKGAFAGLISSIVSGYKISDLIIYWQ